jgi:hypothetical protein
MAKLTSVRGACFFCRMETVGPPGATARVWRLRRPPTDPSAVFFAVRNVGP